MSAAFTPGPWEAKRFHVHVEGKGIVCSVSNPWNDETERQANANLIAAAPDLYAELQQFVNGVETRMIDSPADETLANITDRARKALAKARGEQVPA